jgi:hypothetical protein
MQYKVSMALSRGYGGYRTIFSRQIMVDTSRIQPAMRLAVGLAVWSSVCGCRFYEGLAIENFLPWGAFSIGA